MKEKGDFEDDSDKDSIRSNEEYEVDETADGVQEKMEDDNNDNERLASNAAWGINNTVT